MDIQKQINEIKAEGKILVRKYQVFKSPYNRQETIDMFDYVFQQMDETIVNYKHLPEYSQIIDWLMDSKGKGLLLCGNLGLGKSTILYSVIPAIFKMVHKGRNLKPFSARDLLRVDLSGLKFVLIDEVGVELIANDFGTKIDTVENAICHCEDYVKLLIMSTNLTSEQLLKRYGPRVLDRIERLCKIVVLTGKSLRL